MSEEHKTTDTEPGEGPQSTEQYEFSHEEELIFTDFNYRSIILGGLVLLLGIVSLSSYFINNGPVLMLFTSIFLIIISAAFYLPIYNFRRIIDTSGKDISELMEGINKFVIGWGVMVGILAIYRIIQFIQLFD